MTTETKAHVWRGKRSYLAKDSFGNTIADTSSAYQSPSRTWSDERIGATNRKWRYEVRRHLQATRPYTRSAMSLRVTPGQIINSDVDIGGGVKTTVQVTGEIAYPSSMAFFAPQAIADLKTAVYLKWLKKANAEIATSRGLVSLGELRETIHQIRHPLESLKKGIMDYLNAVPKRAGQRVGRTGAKSIKKRTKAVAEAISGTYLEHANGWAPFISDIDATSRTLAEHYAEPGISYRRIEAAQKVEQANSSKQVTAFETTGDPAAMWRRFQYVFRTSACQIVGEVKVSHNGDPARLLQAAGFSFGQFVPTIYELIPLSYVADYFWNMGDILEGFSFCSSDRAWWSRTVVNKSHGTVTGSVVPVTDGNGTRSGSPGSCEIKGTSMIRDDPGNTSIALEFSLPGSHLFSKLANVGSLGVQSLTSSKLLHRLIHG